MCASCSTACKGHAQIAQSVEQWIENPRVPGSIPGLGTIFKNPKFARASGFLLFVILLLRWSIIVSLRTFHLQVKPHD
jgi:hypothetical protein